MPREAAAMSGDDREENHPGQLSTLIIDAEGVQPDRVEHPGRRAQDADAHSPSLAHAGHRAGDHGRSLLAAQPAHLAQNLAENTLEDPVGGITMGGGDAHPADVDELLAARQGHS